LGGSNVPEGKVMFAGIHGQYYWTEWDSEFLSELLADLPEVVLGKFLINTSFDSGSFVLSSEEIDRGWHKHHALAISPAILDILEIPHDQYDEWYIFASPPGLDVFDECEVFINYGGFSLQGSNCKGLQERFWEQLNSIAPEAYLAEGDRLLFVTRSKEVFDRALQWTRREKYA
jgi:hypothetical protein